MKRFSSVVPIAIPILYIATRLQPLYLYPFGEISILALSLLALLLLVSYVKNCWKQAVSAYTSLCAMTAAIFLLFGATISMYDALIYTYLIPRVRRTIYIYSNLMHTLAASLVISSLVTTATLLLQEATSTSSTLKSRVFFFLRANRPSWRRVIAFMVW